MMTNMDSLLSPTTNIFLEALNLWLNLSLQAWKRTFVKPLKLIYKRIVLVS